MARFDFWTHGVAAILQPTAGSAGTQSESHRTDLGTVVENGVGKETWLHLPVATPTVIEGSEATLRNITVALTLNDNARLERIHVRSGKTLVLDEGVSVVGRTLHQTFDVVDVAPTGLGRGVAISFFVKFLSGAGPGRVELHGAGARFS